jgi:hypothetical protein
MPFGISTSDGARYRIVIYLIVSVVFLSVSVLVSSILASAYDIVIPDVIIGIINMVAGGLIGQLGSIMKAFEKGREELQTARLETEKNCGKGS